MRTAIEAYTLFEGEPPPDEQALVDEGFLRSPMDDWDVIDGVIVAQNPACGDVPSTIQAEEIVTETDPEAAVTVDDILATFTADEIESFGGAACASQVAVITAGANNYLVVEGVEPETIEDLEREGHLSEPVTMWQVVDDELRPTPDSPCPDFIAQATATTDG